MTAPPSLRCETVDVNGITLSYLEAGSQEAPPLVLLHGTFWSRVWQALPALAWQLHGLALDFPGLGHNEGELELLQVAHRDHGEPGRPELRQKAQPCFRSTDRCALC